MFQAPPRFRRSRPLLLLALLSPVSFGTGARADVVAPGQREVPHDVLVAVGAKAKDHLAWQTVIAEGETLGSVAERTLGAASRAQEIARWNQLEDPDRVKAGQVLWIPPKAKAEGERSYRLFFTYSYPFGHVPEPVVVGKPLPFFKWGLRLLAVEEEQVEVFLAAERAQSEARRSGKESKDAVEFPEGSILRSEELAVERQVAVLSTVRSYTTTFTVDSVGPKGGLEVSADRRRGRADEEDSSPVQETMLVSMAAASLVAIGFTARRRRTRRVEPS